MTRFVIEGTWSGYTSRQQRIAHVSVHQRSSNKALFAWVSRTYSIRFDDGTSLYLSARPAKPRERIKEQRGYMELIEDCARYDVASVTALCARRDEIKAKVPQ